MRSDAIWALGIFVAIVVVAALVNRFRPAHRTQIRRLAILFLLQLIAYAIHYGLGFTGEKVWSGRALVAAELLQAFTLVNLGATTLFSVVLPATGVALPMIASDLLVGVGYIASTIGVLASHGLNPATTVASAAAVSAVLAISLQSTLGNIIGGVALQLDGSIKEGDWIQLENGKQGRIRAIRWRHTVVETRDWSSIIVPNAQLLSNNIMILGKREGRPVPQRMWVWFNVDFRFPPTKVITTVQDALIAAPIVGVAPDPPPNCVCMDFTKENRESFATYAVRYWLTDLAADDPTNSRVRARIYTALRRANIPLALPAATRWVQVEDESRSQSKLARRTKERFEVLRSVQLFQLLTDEEVHTLAEGVSHTIYCTGETITRQGAVAHWLYVLVVGEVEIRTKFDPDGEGPQPLTSKTVTRLKAPDVFGEMGLMTGAPRSADVVAMTDVECYRLDKATFEHVLLGRPEIATLLSDKLAQRRMGLLATQEGLDENQRIARTSMERDQILGAIRTFFSL